MIWWNHTSYLQYWYCWSSHWAAHHHWGAPWAHQCSETASWVHSALTGCQSPPQLGQSTSWLLNRQAHRSWSVFQNSQFLQLLRSDTFYILILNLSYIQHSNVYHDDKNSVGKNELSVIRTVLDFVALSINWLWLWHIQSICVATSSNSEVVIKMLAYMLRHGLESRLDNLPMIYIRIKAGQSANDLH